jgi:hypothetical protein
MNRPAPKLYLLARFSHFFSTIFNRKIYPLSIRKMKKLSKREVKLRRPKFPKFPKKIKKNTKSQLSRKCKG